MTSYWEKVRTDGRTDERTNGHGSIYGTNLQSQWVQKEQQRLSKIDKDEQDRRRSRSGSTEIAQYRRRSSKINWDRAKIYWDWEKSTEMEQNLPRSSKIYRDWARSSKIYRNRAKLTEIEQYWRDQPRSTKINDRPRSNRINDRLRSNWINDPPGSTKIHLDELGTSRKLSFSSY